MLLGENFKKARELCNIKQGDLANYLELDQTMISLFENNKRNLKLSDLIKACSLFGLSLDDLHDGNFDNMINVKFRKGDNEKKFLSDIAMINRIALNLKELQEIYEQEN